jgi:hypothetical protein
VDISMKAMGAAFLVYSAIAFVVLKLLGWLVWRRIAGAFRRAPRIEGARAAAGVDLSSVLSRVAEAVERGDARVRVREQSFDLRGEGVPGNAAPDAAARLETLRRLHEQGLITAAEYQAKRAEILSGL